jgi:hypothetical protein
MVTNSKEYSRKYYHIFKAKHAPIFCNCCQKIVSYTSYNKHIQSKKHIKLEKEGGGGEKIQSELKAKMEQLNNQINNIKNSLQLINEKQKN